MQRMMFDPVPVAVALGKVGIEDTFLDVAAHAENLVVCGDARGHAIHDFAARGRPSETAQQMQKRTSHKKAEKRVRTWCCLPQAQSRTRQET